MKKAKICLAFLILCGILFTVVYCIRTEITAQSIFQGSVYTPQGIWSAEADGPDSAIVFSFSLPQQNSTQEQVLLLQSHWTDYDIYVDDSLIFSASNGRAGYCQLLSLPEGDTLTIRFFCENASAESSIEQSKLLLGDKGSVIRELLGETIYALIFAILSLTAGIACVCVGLFTRKGRFSTISTSLAYLGTYILCAGMWILMDSKILILVTQRTGLVETLSFVAFFLMPIPLMGFTKKMLPDRQRIFSCFQLLFALTLLFYVVNEIGNFLSYILILVLEHLLISATIMVMLYTGSREMHRRQDVKLHRIVMGYGVLCVCSAVALVFFYKQLSLAYSLSYMVGISGFVIFLADSVWIALYDQVQENANMALYAKMAYMDAMTGLRNRAAFLEAEKENLTYPDSLAYIMVDANNLKLVNDTLGHQQGDELLIRIAKCILHVVNGAGECYRIGGDEFVVCLKNIPETAVKDYADAIQAEIRIADSQSSFTISAAIGYAWTKEAAQEDLEQLLRQADDAMYDKKKEMKAEAHFRFGAANSKGRT